MRVRHFAALTLAVAICALVGSTAAVSRSAPPPTTGCDPGTTQVEAQDFVFSPDTLTVPTGTTVCWINVGQSAHTVTSDTGVFDSGTLLAGETFTYTFTNTGTFPYYCLPHRDIGMVASITVTGGPPPPPPPPPPAPPPPPPPPPGVLLATVGTNDGTNITLTMNGTRVRHLTAGTYEIQVRDNSTFHNFHLSGPGIDRKTEIDFKGTQTWTVTFTDGVYTFVCDPHASFMKGSFTVGTAQPPPPPPPPRCKVPKVVGTKLLAARRMITRAHCRVGRVHRARSRKPRGRIVKQSPRWGVKRARGARVSLVVSRGKR